MKVEIAHKTVVHGGKHHVAGDIIDLPEDIIRQGLRHNPPLFKDPSGLVKLSPVDQESKIDEPFAQEFEEPQQSRGRRGR